MRATIDGAMSSASVWAIHRVARVTGMRMVAEYIEDDAVLSRLQAVGIVYLQGLAINIPRPIPGAMGMAA